MRTSATGRTDRGEGGFTLVELLIVVTILGLLSAAVVLAMPDSRGSIAREAERFAARAKAAQERAIIEARPMALVVGPGEYMLQRRRGPRWERLESFAWGEEVAASGEGMIVFDPTGMADPAQVVLARDGEQAAVEVRADGSVHVRG